METGHVESALSAGARVASEVIQRSEELNRVAASVRGLDRTPEYLLLEGDSWFDYPLFKDAAEWLKRDFGYKLKSVAHYGDTAAAMAYLPKQYDKFRELFEELAEDGVTPKAVLLSCGGNDIAAVFQALLNHAQSGLPPINAQVLAGLVDGQLRAAILRLIGAADAFAQHYFRHSIAVRVHGYDYPVPDGRGYLGGWSLLPGPWLKPGFEATGYVSSDPQTEAELQANADLMKALIDSFNTMLKGVAALPELAAFVKHVDLRGTLGNRVEGGAYRQFWDNELHATAPGFRLIAAKLHASI